MSHPIAWYREFLPCPALQADVYAFFSFVPGPQVAPVHRPMRREIAFHDPTFCSPQFADGHVSILFELGQTCDAKGIWSADATALRGTVTGPMSEVGRTEGRSRPSMIGIYFKPARAAAFLRAAMPDLADRTVGIEHVWGPGSSRLSEVLVETDEDCRVSRLESDLLARLTCGRTPTGSVNVEALAAFIVRQGGRVAVEALADSAGVSRQNLSRQFRQRVGISPKLYCRLARFQSSLGYAGCRTKVDWADIAVQMGYADQSHMIAEFRGFSALTPQALASGDWFHPFIERAKSEPSVVNHRAHGNHRDCL